ncbi:winged helix-turn-helix domain-containing protein [Nonomuraea sp. SYSU D8015]|uniref:winged helix-turn-helix domain-containing protein n=1 Tax=Nonomuraea sp. SYSU D8015 TaxID=2593644 RepID=UPI001660D9D2|nr:winged helix-turn-helix domain-containing protein [Nonomuraea sp. SYSU D8015]
MIQRRAARPHVAKPVTVAARITSAIDNGTFQPGDRLPSERELAATYQVSRATVREAVALLQEEGRVQVRHGSGTFVAGDPARPSGRRDATYLKVAQAIAAEIDAGEYKPGDLLPSELELGARHKVSRQTVRAAIRHLREQGRVETVHAKGTYVTEHGKVSPPVPPSRRLVQDLRDAITSGRLKPGDPLPSEQELMEEYGLAAITIAIALRPLREEGLIHHIPGKGRFAGPAPGTGVDRDRRTTR